MLVDFLNSFNVGIRKKWLIKEWKISNRSLTLLLHNLVKLITLVWMWTFTTMRFYSAMQNSSKTWQRRWQKVDKIKTINKFKDYVRSSSLRTNTKVFCLLRHWSIAMSTVDCLRPHQTSVSLCFSLSINQSIFV